MSDSESVSDRIAAAAPSVLVALAAGVAGVLGSYGAVGFTPGFVVAPVESLLSRLMPAAVVTFAITVLGDIGQKLNLAFAGALVVLLFAVLAWVGLSLRTQLRSRLAAPVVTAGAVWVAAAALTLQSKSALWAAAGAGLVVALSELSASVQRYVGEPTSDGNGRRRVVTAFGTAAAAGAVGTAVGRSRTDARQSAEGPSVDDGELAYDVGEQLHTAMQRSFTVGDMDPIISEGFYNVDINSVDPDIVPDYWTLSVTGEVETELDLTYRELRERDREHRFVTLRCVGERLNGHKMDTALWTGVPVASIIEEVNPSSECNCVMLHGEDGYSVQFPLEALEPGMLAFGMNGEQLPRSHGAPVRVLVPGHWGETNVKWVTEIEFLHEEMDGYWERRGWEGTGPVKTVAKLHGRERTEDGQIAVGGHTYAGLRGVSAVEVSTDGGQSWNEAELTERLPGATGPATDVGGGSEFAVDAWRIWRYTYDPPEGEHEVVVRAIERDGTVQPQEETGPVPDGPAGWVSDTIDPRRI